MLTQCICTDEADAKKTRLDGHMRHDFMADAEKTDAQKTNAEKDEENTTVRSPAQRCNEFEPGPFTPM